MTDDIYTPPPLVSTGIRIEGTEEQINEAFKRLSQVFFVNENSKLYSSRKNPSVFLKYARLYSHYPEANQCLLDQLQAALRDIDDLEEHIFELKQELQKLKNLPQPKPYDVVLSPNNELAN